MTTNKLGDMLLEMRNPNIPQARVSEITRLFNELSDREEQYKSWLSKVGNGAHLENAAIKEPTWLSSPLRVLHAYLTTDTEIANDTHTKVTFESIAGDDSIFHLHNSDYSKIAIDQAQFNVRMDGIVAWESNNAGYRNMQLRIYDADGNSLGSQDLHTVESVLGTTTVIPFSYTEDIRGLFSTVVYMEFWVRQNSGVALDVVNFVLAVSIA